MSTTDLSGPRHNKRRLIDMGGDESAKSARMAVTSIFAESLRDLRVQRSLTQQALVDCLEEHHGLVYTSAAVSEWERGKSHPEDRRTALALDGCLGAEGAILESLGYRPDEPSTAERLSALEQRLDAIERSLRSLRRRSGQQ